MTKMMKKSLFLLLILFTLSACAVEQVTVSIPTIPAQTTQKKASPSPLPRKTPTPVRFDLSNYQNFVIHCGVALQLRGQVPAGITLTLLDEKEQGYYFGRAFFKGQLSGEILISSEVKEDAVTIQNNNYTANMQCFLGYEQEEEVLGMIVPLTSLLNEQDLQDAFEGTILIATEDEQRSIVWKSTYQKSTTKTTCIKYKIVTNPYPCNQDCAAIETEPGCACFCANFLFYDENCEFAEINPDCICVCRGDEKDIYLDPR